MGANFTGANPGDLRAGGLRNSASMAEIGETLSRRELLADGLNRHEVAHAEERGWLIRVSRSDYRFAVNGLRLRMELVLRRAPDAVFSHRTAAYGHGLLKNPPAWLDAVVPRGRRHLSGARVRRRTAIRPVRVRGIPMTTVAATLSDMLDEWGRDVTALIIDDRFPTNDSRAHIIADLTGLPAAKRSALAPLLRWTPEGSRSKTEGHIARAVQLRGYDVRLDVRIGPYLWDIVHHEAKLIVEFDSRRYHLDPQAFRVDRARQNNAVRRGWAMLRYTDDDIEFRFDEVIDEICATIDFLLGEPARYGEWDEHRCERLYMDRQIAWNTRNQTLWPY